MILKDSQGLSRALEDSQEILEGFLGILKGFPRDSQGILKGFPRDSQVILKGFCKDSTRILCGMYRVGWLSGWLASWNPHRIHIESL